MTHIENLDYFLKYIYTKEKDIYSQDIYKELKEIYSERDLTLTIEKLLLDKYINITLDKSPNVNKYEPPYYCGINYHGLIFHENGGYKSEIFKNKKATLNSNIKNVITTINAIIILTIAAAGVYVSYDSNKKNETINQSKLVIDSLNKKINTLEDIKKANTTNIHLKH